jgi:hypothetical protein
MPEYAVLVYGQADADFSSITPEYLEALDRYPSQVEELGGRIVTGYAVEPAASAKAVSGDVVKDGTLVGGDLAVVGFFILEAPDLDTAVEIAKLNPATQDGGVELRPLFNPPAD